MSTALRQRRRHRAPASVIGIVAAAIALVLGLAGPALAASVAEVIDTRTSESATIHGAWPDSGARDIHAGLFDLRIDGEVDAQAYCIDINTAVREGATLDEVDWETSGVNNLEKVEAILRHYYPNGDGPDGHKITGTDAQKAAATQAAIWHYTDGFELTDDEGENDPVIIANYKAILAAVEAGLEGFGEPNVSLSITPPESTEGAAAGLVGPYVINTTAAAVTLTPSEGVTLHNEDGSPFTGTVTDGTQIWLSSDAAGEGSITATASAEVSAGRVFYTRGVQRLVLASTVTTEANADASVTFTDAPPPTTAPSTTTTEQETTTTVPITVETTVVDNPTTTVPVTPNQDTGGGLPVTGAQTMVLVAVAVALLAAGTGFAVISRRKRLEGEA